MVIFPTTQQIINHYGFDFLLGTLALGVGIVLLYKLLHWQQGVTPRPHILQLIAAPIVFAIGVGFAIGLYPSVISVLMFRFDVTQVTEIQVEYINGKDKCSHDEPVIIRDKEVITDGLKRLETAQRFILSRETILSSLGEGYRLQLKLANSTRHYRYLLVYKRSTSNRRVTAVVPHFFLAHTSGGISPEFSSPEFHKWIALEVDPLFENCERD